MWPFSSSYPERGPEDVDGKTFDYVIVGGGCGGCVLASRLSEDPSVSVLVLEKGRVKDTWYTWMPLLTQNFEFPWLQSVSRLSDPIAELGGRRMKLWAGEALGGTTRVNGMLLTRGVPGGYNEWAQSFGLRDWAWDKVEPFFKRSENAMSHPGAAHRGHSGRIENRQAGYRFSSMRYYEKAAAAVGLPVESDLNDPKGSAQGFFYLDQTVDSKSRRLSAYRAWLNVAIATERSDRLSVCTGVVASRLEIDPKGKQVTGVHVIHARPAGGDKEYFVKARREVIVCSGTVCTPQLLMLSGIGLRDQLKANGIPLVHELPAVGQNLMDHHAVPIMHELPMKDTLHQIATLWGILWHLFLYYVFGKGFLADSSTPASIFFRTSAVDDNTMTVKTSDDSGASTMDASSQTNIPDVELMVTPINANTEITPKGLFLATLYTTLVQPLSPAGRIELASTDPRAPPRIHYPRVLSEPRDLTAIRKACRFAMRLLDEFANTSGYPHPAPLTFAPGMDLDYLDSLYAEGATDSWRGGAPAPTPNTCGGVQPDINPVSDLTSPPQPTPSTKSAVEAQQSKISKTDWRTVTDAEIDAYVKRTLMTALHLTSSCRMSLTPQDGVVDQRLRVHGVRNLRIADASVFPKITSAHTMAPTVMVAERCADFLREEWEERKGK